MLSKESFFLIFRSNFYKIVETMIRDVGKKMRSLELLRRWIRYNVYVANCRNTFI